MATGGPGLVAVGSVCLPACLGAGSGGIAATSLNGSSWSVEPVTGTAELRDVASSGGQVFALGVSNQDVEQQAALELWRTDDGVAWQRVTGLPSIPDLVSYASADIAASSDRLIIVGWAEVAGPDATRNFSYSSPPGS